MKIAVISDIHGNDIALKYALKDIKTLNIDELIVLGDVVMKGPNPSECLKLLRNEQVNILAWIKGNTDLWFSEIPTIYNSKINKEELDYTEYARQCLSKGEMEFLSELPEKKTLEIDRVSILCVHGTPKSIVEAIDETVPEEDIKKAIIGVSEAVILSGHSHTTYIGEVGGKKLFNVGSVGNQLDGDNRISYGILDIKNGKVELLNRRIEYPIDELLDGLEKIKFPYRVQYEKIIRQK